MLTEALLAAITETVFSFLLEKTGLTEKTQAWLGRDPQRLAFQVAFARAFARFAHAYPQWITSLFDEHFLMHQAAPLLARTLVRTNILTPAELATAWADQMGLSERVRTQFMAELTPVASNFLRWLDAELSTRREFQPLFDSRALDTMAESSQQTLEALEQVRTELNNALTAFQQASKYQVAAQQVQGMVIGDSNLVINHFIAGVRDLPTDYAARVKNFLIEYLGTPDHPVPFGGRTQDFAQLNTWLDDHQAPPYLLLAAPAGRGKSALLARWSHALTQRDDLAIAYFPVSIRFRTNLANIIFPALTAQLAKLRGEKVPTDLNMPQEVWRGILSDYIARPQPDDRQLVVILDGVDEAADWEAGADLFPLAPPPNLRVVLSARYLANDRDAGAWLNRLGWNRYGLARAVLLHALDEAGVADVLRQMSFPLDRLGERVDIVRELHRISEGDPLLVKLYVDDLVGQGELAARLRSKDLQTIRPGLIGYFDRWWGDQRQLWGKEAPLREPTVQILLNLLACAFGPLSQDNLFELAPAELDLSSWTLEQAIEPLKRFVIGDGKQQGYVYSHPRLGAYFYERLQVRERQKTEDLFLAWGQKMLTALNRGELAPNNAPAYLIQYYGVHLERSGCKPGALLSLISDGWRQASYFLWGSYTGFLSDVDRARRSVESVNHESTVSNRPVPSIANEILCALCHASVNSLVGNIPSELIVALLKEGVWSAAQALAHARQKSSPEEQADALEKLAPYLPSDQLNTALGSVRALKNQWAQATALTALVPYLPSELLRSALEIMNALENKQVWYRAFAAIAPYLPKNFLPELLATVLSIEDLKEKEEALLILLPFLSVDAQLYREASNEAIKVLHTIDDANDRLMLFTELVPHVPKDEQIPLLNDMLAGARSITSPVLRAREMQRLVPFFPESDSLQSEALDSACAIESDEEKMNTFEKLAPFLTEPLLQKAISAARTMQRGTDKALALMALASYLPLDESKEVLWEAFEVASRSLWEGGSSLAKTVAALLPYLSETKRQEVLDKALNSVRAVGNERIRAKILAALVTYLPEAGQLEVLNEALEAARTIDREASESEREVDEGLVLEVALHFAEMGYPGRTLDIVKRLSWKSLWERALVSLAPYLKEQLVHQAIRVAHRIEDKKSRGRVLTVLADKLSSPERLPILLEVLNIVQTIDDQYDQAHTLAALAPYLPESLIHKAAASALNNDLEEVKPEVLLKLIPLLPKDLLFKIFPDALLMMDSETMTKVRAELLSRILENVHLEELEIELHIDVSHWNALRWIVLYIMDTVWQMDFDEWVEILPVLVPHLPADRRLYLLHETLIHLPSHSTSHQVKKLIFALIDAGYPPKEAINLVRGLSWAGVRTEVFIALPPHLAARRYSQQALEAVREIEYSDYQFKALREIAPDLPKDSLREALEIARSFTDYTMQYRAGSLGVLASCLPEEEQFLVQEEALEILSKIANGDRRREAMEMLVPSLPKRLLGKALAAAQEIDWMVDRARALKALALRQAQLGYPDEALAIVRTIDYKPYLPEAVASLGPYLSRQLLQEALGIVHTIEEVEKRAKALAELVPHLPEADRMSVLQEIIIATRDMKSVNQRLNILLPAISQLKTNESLKVLREMVEIGSVHELSGLLQYLAQLPVADLYPLWLKVIHRLSESSRQELLAGLCLLVPIIVKLGGTDAFVEILNAMQNVCRWWP